MADTRQPQASAEARADDVGGMPSDGALESPNGPLAAAVRAHMRTGWVALLVFVTMGSVLEALHAFKSGAYLGVGNETRRLMWTLAHAHGIGLSLVHIAFGATLRAIFTSLPDRLSLAGKLLTWGTVLVPGGFLLGGIVTYGGDPGVGVFLVPLGALAIWIAVLLTAFAITES